MLQFVLGPANSGKTTEILDRIAAETTRGDNGVILIVPEQNSFETEKAVLGRLGGGFSDKIEVLTFSRLAELVARQTGGIAGIPISNTGRLVAMGQALSRVKPLLKYYGKLTSSPDFIKCSIDLITEFKQGGLGSDDLTNLSEGISDGSLKIKLSDFSLIMAEYDAIVSEKNIDTLTRLNVLCDSLDECNFFENKAVFFDSFFGFTGQQYKVIDKIFKWTDNVCFSLPCVSLTDCDDTGVFTNITKAAQRIIRIAAARSVKTGDPVILDRTFFKSPALLALENGLRSGESAGNCDGSVSISSAANMYDEADSVLARIHCMVRRDPGLRYRDFAVMARDMNKYKNALQITAHRYDIPMFIDERRPADSLPLMIYTLSAFSAAMSFSTGDIFKMLKTGLFPLSANEINQLENYAYVWNVGRADWLEPFTRNPDGFSDTRGAADYSEQLASLNATREKLIQPLEMLAASITDSDARHISAAVYKFIIDTDVPSALKKAAESAEVSGDFESAEALRSGYDLMMNILSGLASGFGGGRVSADEYFKMLALAVAGEDVGTIPQKLDCIIAGSAEKIRPARPRYTFIIGFNQGDFPRISSGGLLSARERTALCGLDVKIKDCHLSSSVEELYLFYRTVLSCSEGLFISYVRSSVGGSDMMPSAFVGRIKGILPDCTDNTVDDRAVDIDKLETAAASFGKMCAAINQKTPDAAALKEYFRRNSDYCDRLSRIESLTSGGAEHLNPAIARQLYGKNLVLSASRVDTFARCGFSYFCKYGLKAKPLRRAEMDVMQRGTIVHYVLEKMISENGEALEKMNGDERRLKIDNAVEEYAEIMTDGKKINDYRLEFMFERVKTLMDELVERIGEEMSVADFKPEYCELGIGFSDEDPVKPMKIPLDDGSVSIVGSVDRVDTMKYDDGLVFRIIDYKTGTKKFALPDILYGLNMQMLIYLCAIADSGIKGVESLLYPAGILYFPAKRAIASGEDGDKQSQRDARMNGLLINNDDYLTAMNRGKDGRFLPLSYLKNGQPRKSASLISPEELGIIKKHITAYLHEMGDRLHAGDIAVSPVDGVSSTACEYCDYAGVCLKSGEVQPKKIQNISNDSVFNLIKEEDSHGIQTN